jgi:hypothetical protein
LRRDLAGLEAPRPALRVDPQTEQAVQDRLVDWRGVLHANPAGARAVLAKLLRGRLTFTPRVDGRREFYEFNGEGTILPILEGIVDDSITRCGVPNGIRTRVLALKGPRPRPLDDRDVDVRANPKYYHTNRTRPGGHPRNSFQDQAAIVARRSKVSFAIAGVVTATICEQTS